MLKKIALVVAVLLVVLLALIATRPDTFRVERSTVINAPAGVIFPHVNTLAQWNAWSPWEKMDPAMHKEFAGPASGTGAVYHWTSDKVGEGQMTILESRPERIDIKLEFFKPFKATNDATFTFAPAGAGTNVTWAMTGKNNFAAKAFHMVMDMDKMVGGDFAKGLASLKEISEAQAEELAMAKPATAATK